MSQMLVNQLSRMAAALSKEDPPDSRASTSPQASNYYAIRVVDSVTRRGVPLVYLRTTYKAVYVTDSGGYVAFLEPGLMTGEPVWVTVTSYGYESPPGLYDCPGVKVHPRPGGTIEIALRRTQVAERLYRMTGYGIYRDSMLLGLGRDARGSVPLEEPLLNAQVTGSDTIQCTKYRNKLFWMWQDTNRLAFELGNFSMTGATTDLPSRSKLDPDRGLNFQYYKIDGKANKFARAMARIKLHREGNFPIWIDGLTVVPDQEGKERMLGTYLAAGPGLTCVERGLTIWNEREEVFERHIRFEGCENGKDVPAPSGHAMYVFEGGRRYVYYGKNVRVEASFESAKDPELYEAFTCLKADGKTANRNEDGKLIWNWLRGGHPVNFETTDRLLQSGIIRQEEAPYRLKDLETGQAVRAHHVSIAWNPMLKLFVNIFQQHDGDSLCGEIWFSTSQSPEGPWVACRKVATHTMNTDGFQKNNNDLYNPVQHSELVQEGGRYIYFSATFVNTFSGNPWPTPYYDYNNIMYKLDLEDIRLILPYPPPGLSQTSADDGV